MKKLRHGYTLLRYHYFLYSFVCLCVLYYFCRHDEIYVFICVHLCTLCAAYAGMVCDLDETVGRRCILQSPLIADAFSWTCMLVSYQLSSDDVKLTLDVLSDGTPNVSYTLLANQSAIWISNEGFASSLGLQLTASRYLVSTADYEFALVSSVSFLPCSTNTGM